MRRCITSRCPGDQLLRSERPTGVANDNPGKQLGQQLFGGAIGLFRVGAGELVGEGVELGDVDVGNLRQDAEHRPIERQPAGVGELDRPADAPFGQSRQRLGLWSSELGAVPPEELQDQRTCECRQRKVPAARADRRQQQARAVADQQQQPPLWRLFEDLEQRVGSVAVHLLGAVDDDDAPPLLGRGQPEKTGDRPRILDDDVAA